MKLYEIKAPDYTGSTTVHYGYSCNKKKPGKLHSLSCHLILYILTYRWTSKIECLSRLWQHSNWVSLQHYVFVTRYLHIAIICANSRPGKKAK